MDKGFTLDQAVREASRCLLCLDAPCSKGCPAGTDPGRFIRKLRLKNLKGAIATVRQNNPLGGVCGVVCPTCELCGQGCTAAGLDRPIQIGRLQRFLVEYGWQIGFAPLTPPKKRNGLKVAIAGAGPSGLTAAAMLARAGFEPVVFEKRGKPGGMLRYAIPEHRLSEELLDREIREIRELGVEIVCDHPLQRANELDRLFAEGFAAVYLATGTWSVPRLGLMNGNADGVTDALAFLGLARADRARFEALVQGRRVAVMGGGDTAMDAAVTAKLHGALDVSVLYRRSFQQMPATTDERNAAIAAGVHLVVLTQPLDYLVENGRLFGLKVQRTELKRDNDNGRPVPVPVEGSEHVVWAEVAVEAVGLQADPAISNFAGLALDRQRRVLVSEETGLTSVGGVYAGGDCVRGASIVARAVEDGKRAADAIIRALSSTKRS
jgi:NADPH-dependent glutamate synthase beta subunit-like oxidoreductase